MKFKLKKISVTIFLSYFVLLSQAQEDFINNGIFQLENQSITLENNIDIVKPNDNNQEQIEEILFEKEIKFNETFSYWAQTNNIEKIKYFLNNGTSINKEIYDGNTVILLAAMRGNTQLLNSLMEYKPNLKKVNSNKENILHLAIKNGNIDFLNSLEKHISYRDINALMQRENKYGALPAFLFFQRKTLDLQIWDWIKRFEIKYEHKDKMGLSILHYALVPNNCEGFKIIKNDVNLDSFKQDYSLCEKEEIIVYNEY